MKKIMIEEVNMAFVIINIISFIIVLIGAINWGLIGIFDWNLVTAIFGGFNVGSRIVYCLVFAAALWLIFYSIYSMGLIDMRPKKNKSENE